MVNETEAPTQQRTATKVMLTCRAERDLVDDVEKLRRLHGRRGITRTQYVLLAVGRQVRADKALFGVETRRATDG